MKTHFYLSFLCFALCLKYKQADAQQIAVEARKQNILVIGRDNPIYVVVSGYSCKNIVVKTDNGKIEKQGDCEYNVIPLATPQATIKIFSRNGNKLLGERQFRVKQISPFPVAAVAGRHNHSISVEQLRFQLGLAVIVEGFDWDPRITITGYFMTLIKQNGDCRSFSPTTDAYFTQEMKEALSKVKSGDRIIFTSIMAVGPSNIPLQLDPMELKVQ